MAMDESTESRAPTAMRVLGAKSLMSDKVVDTAGEDIGKIEELMIDLSNGGISYAVLSHGGIMGMGDKLFAIPWQSFTVDTDNKQLLLGVSKDKLDNAPGFDKNNWPDMTKEEFRSEVYGYYGYGGAGYEGFHGRDKETSMSGLSGSGSQNI